MGLSAFARWVWSRAPFPLIYMAAVSGGNGAAARLATGQVPPLLLVFLRWFIVCATLALLLGREERRELSRLVRHHWFTLGWMGLLGYAGFNALFYLAAYQTSGINLTLLQSATPVFVLLGSAAIFRIRVRATQIAGMGLTFVGVLLVAAKGDLARIANLSFGQGDILVLIVCVFYAAYTLGLRVRPPVPPLVFFAGMAGSALFWSLPMAGAEIVFGHAFWPSGEGWLITLFIAFGPSLTGQLGFMRGVDLIGPARAGLFVNLIPIFGALAAVVILGERFARADAVAIVLALAGISLAEWQWPKRASRSDAETARDPGLP